MRNFTRCWSLLSTRRILLGCLALLCACVFWISRVLAVEPPPPTLEDQKKIITAVQAENTKATTLIGKVDTLYRAIDLKADGAELNVDTIKALADGGKALKAEPIGALVTAVNERLGAPDAAEDKRPLAKALKDLEGALAALDTLKKSTEKTRDDKKKIRDDKKKEYDDKKAIPTTPAAELATLEMAYKLAETDFNSAQAAVDAVAMSISDGNTLRDGVKASISRLTMLRTATEAGSFAKTLDRFFAYGNRLTTLQQTSLNTTKLVGLAKEPLKADPLAVAKAFAAQSIPLSRAEPFAAPLQEAVNPLRSAAMTSADGFARLAPALAGTGADFTAVIAEGDKLCLASRNQYNDLKQCMEALDELFGTMRVGAELQHKDLAAAVKILRDALLNPTGEEFAKQLLDALDKLGPGIALAAEQRIIDETWPVAASFLNQRWAAEVKNADAAFTSAREAIARMRPFVALIQDFRGGNLNGFVSQHVRLYYLPSVPRLIKVLNSDWEILNPEGAAAVKDAEVREDALRKLELEMADNLGKIVGIRRRLEGVGEEVRLAEVRVKNAQKQYDTVSRQLADLGPKKAAAEKAATDQGIKLKGLTDELTALKTEKTNLEAQITAKEKEIADLSAVVPPDMVKIEAAKKELATLRGKLPDLESRISSKQKQVDEAQTELDKKNADKKFYGDVFTSKEKEQTEAKTALDEQKNTLGRLTGETGEDEASLKALRKRQEGVENQINEQRRNIELNALAENRAFGEARERAPIYVARANVLSPDPVKRVTLFGFGDSKTLLMRGKPEDVERTLEIIAGFDAPAPQARVTLWTLQFNADNSQKMNNRLRDIDRAMADLRSDISYYQETLRNALGKQVNLLQQDMQSYTRGTALELSPRMARSLFYPREVRERLGQRLPCDPYWLLAQTFQRLKTDFEEMRVLAVLICQINQRIEELKRSGGGGDDKIKRLNNLRKPLDRLIYATFEELRSSYQRFSYYASTENLEKLGCSEPNPHNCIHLLALKNAGGGLCRAKDCLRRLIEQVVRNLIEEHAEICTTCKSGQSHSHCKDCRRCQHDLHNQRCSLCNEDRLGQHCQHCQHCEHDGGAQAEDSLVARYGIEPLEYESEALKSQNRTINAFRSGRESIQDVEQALRTIAANLFPTPKKGVYCCAYHAGKTKGERPDVQAALSLKDAEYVTRWTLPDAAHSTTLGEAMFVLTLARRSQRLAVLRTFTRDLVRQRSVDQSSKSVSHASRERYEDFINDTFRVLQGLVSSPPRHGTTAEPGAMPRFPGLPKALLGAINGNSVPLNDDELTANQHEVLLALLSKGRYACGTEIQHLVRQIDWYRTNQGRRFEANKDGYLDRLRDQYLPLVGWFSQADVDRERDEKEVTERLEAACRIPVPYRNRGLQRVANSLSDVPLSKIRAENEKGVNGPEVWDRIAWSLAREQVSGNSLAVATPRVAAADDMIKRLMKVMEDDIDYYFVSETLEELQRLIDARPSGTSKRIGAIIKNMLGVGSKPVRLGIIERTSLLATNRLVARISPNATAGLEIPGAEDFLLQSQQLAQIAQGVNNSFFAPERSRNAIGAAGTAAGIASIAGVAGSALGPIGALAGVFSLLEEQKRQPPGEVYTLNSGNTFKLTPIFDPSGQALRFKFDHVSITRVREPDGTINPLVPRVERLTTNTEVQVSNLEVQEVARYHQNAQLGIPEKRTGGVPFLRTLPILKDIPLVGYYTRQKGRAGVVQESVVLGQSVIYPTVGEIVDLLVDSPRRLSLGELPPAGLWEPHDRSRVTLSLENEDHKPLEGQELILKPLFAAGPRDLPLLHATTDKQGQVVFDALKQKGEYQLRLLNTDRTVALDTLTISEDSSMRLALVARRPVGLTPTPIPAVTLYFWRLEGEKEMPVPGIFINLVEVGGDRSRQFGANGEGELRIKSTELGQKGGKFRLEFGFGLTGWRAEPAEVDIPDPSGASLTRRIRLIPPAPAGSAPLRLRLLAPVGNIWAAVPHQLVTLLSEGNPPVEAITDDQGVAHFFTQNAPVERRRYIIRTPLTMKGYIPQPATVDFAEGDRAFVEVRLTSTSGSNPDPVPQPLRVYLSERKGKSSQAAAGVRIELRPPNAITLIGITGQDGIAGFKPPAGSGKSVRYEVLTNRPGLKPIPGFVTYTEGREVLVPIELVPLPPTRGGSKTAVPGGQKATKTASPTKRR